MREVGKAEAVGEEMKERNEGEGEGEEGVWEKGKAERGRVGMATSAAVAVVAAKVVEAIVKTPAGNESFLLV